MAKQVMVIIVCLFAAAQAVDSTATRLGNLEKKVEWALSKAGISFNGEFRSQYFTSEITGPGAIDSARRRESNEYTSVDFDISARPNDAITGRLIFRMHQNWQNFFSDINNPIFSRWISIDGSVASGMFSYHAGDFKARYSPLTLYSPDCEILYEPAVFKRMRDNARSEVFLGDNNRLLQGVNTTFDAEIKPLFDEFHFGLMGARLRNTGTNFKNGSMVTMFFEEGLMQKFAVGSNLDMRFLKGVTLGGSGVFIFDQPESFQGDGGRHDADSLAQSTRVYSVRPGVDVAQFLQLPGWKLNAGLEAAFSQDDSAYYTPDTLLNKVAVNGSAFDAGVKAFIPFTDAHNVTASLSYLRNDPWFRNDLAQSPDFIGRRVMNVDNDVMKGRSEGHYSTFDALYHYVFKFTPSDKTNGWTKAPFTKNSYTRTVFTQEELSKMKGIGMLDPSVQLVMPFGPATANRNGVTIRAGGNLYGGKVGATALLTSVAECEGVTGAIPLDTARDTTGATAKTSFLQYGAGASVDLSAWAPALKFPFVLSCSFVHSTADNPGASGFAYSPWSITSDFVNIGLYYKFIKRVALLLGSQGISNTVERRLKTEGQLQFHWRGGVEWSVNPTADIVFTVGQIIVTNKDKSAVSLSATGPVTKDFAQTLVDLSLKVGF
jgi:hypothetical protein